MLKTANYKDICKGGKTTKKFTYTITDPLGIHAHPAGLLAKVAKSFSDTVVTVTKPENTVKANHLMKLMGLGVKRGDQVTVAAEGPAEAEAIAAMENFFQENL